VNPDDVGGELPDYHGELFDALDEEDPIDLRALVENTIGFFDDESRDAVALSGEVMRESLLSRLPWVDLEDPQMRDLITVLCDELLRPTIAGLVAYNVDEDLIQVTVAATMACMLRMLEPA
jgi:hypothetical protein